MTVTDCIQLMKDHVNELAQPVPVDGMQPMTFGCDFSGSRLTKTEVVRLVGSVPDDLILFWESNESARLFVDQVYGQWGLEIQSPQKSLEATQRFQERRPTDTMLGDLVVGHFLGDSELLIARCDKSLEDFGSILVALPIDPRQDWYIAAPTFQEFLELYATSGGEKFWTRPRGSDYA